MCKGGDVAFKKKFFFEYEKGLCVFLLLKIIVSMKRVMQWFFMHIVTFKRLLLVWKGVMCMFGGWGKICEICKYAFLNSFKI